MQTIEANKLIEKIQKEISKSGINSSKLVEQLTELREFALKEEDPTLTKVLRLTYEHIAEYGSFNIPIPADELVAEGDEEDAEAEMMINSIETDEDRVESLNYLLSLMHDRENPSNRQELFEYRDALKNY
ncbi:MAG: hypothetical protein CVT95_04495 [Bacteroidetes bacterium HGW-Bacteroidetes-12]|jgi:hypothetical protein|nr:MAG: hypothetical protein CVT95_04495 [Bacteroidetes bacterium HGW-Bacteroidetes-12]